MSESCHSGVSPSVESSPISLNHSALAGFVGPSAQRRPGEANEEVRRGGVAGPVCAPCEDASPRIVTTGGNSFPSVTPEKSCSALALIDWFAFTVTPPDGCGLPWMFAHLVDLFHIPEMTSTGKGWFGYAHRLDLGGFGILAHGGESQRGSYHVEINASGCAHVQEWEKVRAWGEAYGATITRVDLAHDDMDGETVSISSAREWLEAGDFAANGRPPDASLIDDLGSGKGKTLYIGNRQSGKLCRVYEKGKQLGDISSPWARVEVELRNKGRVIPWDVLTHPGHYLAGAYPCLSFLSAVQEKVRTITKIVTVTFESAVSNARQMMGKLVNVMMQYHSGDAFAVVKGLKREGIPGRLENYADFLPQIFDGGGNVALVN